MSCVSSQSQVILLNPSPNVYMRMRFKDELISWMGTYIPTVVTGHVHEINFLKQIFGISFDDMETSFSQSLGIIYDARRNSEAFVDGVCRLVLLISYWRQIQLIFPSILFMVWQVFKKRIKFRFKLKSYGKKIIRQKVF